MRHSRVFINDRSSDRIAYTLYCSRGTNRAELERMKRILNRAIERELTPRQRDCLTLYYLSGMKMKDIAAHLGLSRSTVTRHIQAAEKNLKNIARYYS